MGTDLEGAVAKLRLLPAAEQEKLIETMLVALCDKIDAQEAELTSITRERDGAREENARLRDTIAEIAQARADQMVAWFKERDAMREASRLILRDSLARDFNEHWDSYTALAALVNGEVG